jgi:hypothetical protein
MSYFLKQFVSSQKFHSEFGIQVPVAQLPFVEASKLVPVRQNKREVQLISRAIKRQ